MSIVFQSGAMLQQLDRARKYARSSVAILLTGESGTGKELVAKLLHDASTRKAEPYVRVNCAALTESLVESELFGHEAGAFTGANLQRIGRFESVGKGTLFLDEIGELSGTMQAKLLRVLEEREFQRVGSNDNFTFAGRVVAATNRDLESEIQDERFRQDLYYRLNVLSLRLPPLRERREDIPLLVQHFIRMSQNDLPHPVKGVTRRVMQQLCEYDWPGNVRELKNTIFRECLLATTETIDQIELPVASVVSVQTPLTVCRPPQEESAELPDSLGSMPLEQIERLVILHRLRVFGGNKTEAAAALGVTSRTLRNKVMHYRKLGYVG